MLPVLDGRRDEELVFEQLSFQQWLRYNEVPLSQVIKHYYTYYWDRDCYREKNDVMQMESIVWNKKRS